MSFNGYNTNTQIPIPSKGMSLVQNDPSYASYLQNIIINSPNQLSVRYGVVLKHRYIDNPPILREIYFSNTLMISYFVTSTGESDTIIYQCYYIQVPFITPQNIVLGGDANVTTFVINIGNLTQAQKDKLKSNFYSSLKLYIKNLAQNNRESFNTLAQDVIIDEQNNQIRFSIQSPRDAIDDVNGYQLFYERAMIARVPKSVDSDVQITILKDDLDAGVIAGSINYQNSLIIFNGVDPCYAYNGELYEMKSDVPVPLTGAVNKASATVISFQFDNKFLAELQKYLKVGERVTLASGGNYIQATFTITNVAFNGNICTLTINATADNPIPIEVKTVLYKKGLPHFSEICVINDRLWALPEGRSGLSSFRKDGKQMLVYYADKAKSMEWYTASGILPFIQMAANSDANDNIETIRAWEGRVLFMGKKRIQVWNNADPTENDDARNINIAEFAWQKTENIGLFHKRSIIEMPGILLFLSDTGIGTIAIDGFNNLAFNSEISRDIWDKTKEQINSIKTEDEYRNIRAFKYNYGGFFGFKIGYICYIYQANGIYSWGTFSGAFSQGVAISQNPIDTNLYLSGNNGELLVYADKRENKSYIEYKYENVTWQISYNWLQLPNSTKASRIFINANSLGETKIEVGVNFNMNDFLEKTATITTTKKFSLYNLPDLQDGEGIAYTASFVSNYYSAAINSSNELLKNNTYSFNSVKINMSGNISRGLQIFNISLVN
jgi:hypothetical protein